jgi:hypothetical protein
MDSLGLVNSEKSDYFSPEAYFDVFSCVHYSACQRMKEAFFTLGGTLLPPPFPVA